MAMSRLPDNVREDLEILIPESVKNDVVCFVFYDNHPKGNSDLDITICTKNGEIKEYFQKDVLLSLDLQIHSVPTEVNIYRNLKFEVFYIVSTKHEIIIISSKDKCVVKKISNVEKYYFDDNSCNGQSFLKVVRTDDAVPVTYDDNFNIIEEFSEHINEESSPIINELKRKLTEAQYSYECNLKTLKEYRSLRQQATLATCSKLHPNDKHSIFKSSQNVIGALKVKGTPWIKVCNQKIVIAVPVVNEYSDSLQNLLILLTSQSARTSLIYKTRLFEKITTSPFWVEHDQKVPIQKEFTLTCVLDVGEVKYRVTSRIDISIAIFYKVLEKDYVLPLDDIKLSSLETMADDFDALCGENCDDSTILSILATTNKTELHLTHIKQTNEQPVSYIDILCLHLHMEKIHDNVIVYKKSPYHVFNGIMLVFDEVWSDKEVTVTVYSRSPPQVLALIHSIHSSIPHRIISTTSNITFELKLPKNNQQFNYSSYAASMLKQSGIILEYLDNSMIRMSESKNSVVLNAIGSQIDLFAGGLSSFVEFKNKLEEEAKEGVKLLVDDVDCSDDVMIVD